MYFSQICFRGVQVFIAHCLCGPWHAATEELVWSPMATSAFVLVVGYFKPMEQPTSKMKLVNSAADVGAMGMKMGRAVPVNFEKFFAEAKCKVMGRAVPVNFEKFFAEAKRKVKIVQFHIFGQHFLCGDDPLRNKGGSCICLLMASGFSIKRLSVWMGDADEGLLTNTIFPKRLELSVLFSSNPDIGNHITSPWKPIKKWVNVVVISRSQRHF
jgi:hypothetical protein